MTKDVHDGDIVGGIPARVIGRVEDLVERLQHFTDIVPWHELIKQREGAYDPAIEAQLKSARVKHFFGDPESASFGLDHQ